MSETCLSDEACATRRSSPLHTRLRGGLLASLLAALSVLGIAAPAATAQTPTVSVALYEARGPGDARPFGPQLAVITQNTSTLPLTTWVPGPPPSLQQAAPPSVQISFNLASMNALIQPGKSYTLVVTVTGTETVFVRTVPAAGSAGSGVAFKPAGGALTPLPNAVQRSIEGHCTYSQTAAHEVPSRVTIHLEMDDGRELTGTAVVASQAAVDNEWLGAAPGELPALELDDS